MRHCEGHVLLLNVSSIHDLDGISIPSEQLVELFQSSLTHRTHCGVLSSTPLLPQIRRVLY